MQTVYFKRKLGVIKITGGLNGLESNRIDEGTFQKKNLFLRILKIAS